MKTDISAAIAALEPILARADAEAKGAPNIEAYSSPCLMRMMCRDLLKELTLAERKGWGVALPESPALRALKMISDFEDLENEGLCTQSNPIPIYPNELQVIRKAIAETEGIVS